MRSSKTHTSKVRRFTSSRLTRGFISGSKVQGWFCNPGQPKERLETVHDSPYITDVSDDLLADPQRVNHLLPGLHVPWPFEVVLEPPLAISADSGGQSVERNLLVPSRGVALHRASV